MIFVIPYFLPHQGCPHQCLFCNQHAITGKKISRSELQQDIEETIRVWLGRRNKKIETHFSFYGGSFTCLPLPLQDTMLKVVEPFLHSGEVQHIRLSTRPDCIDGDICRHLRDRGVKIVELGVQSLDDSVLTAARRGHTERNCIEAVAHLRDSGITAGVQLMPGLPLENRRSFMNTVGKAVQLRPSFVRLYPALVVKESELAELYKKGEYRPLSLKKAVILTAWAKKQFESEGIKVVRMGLQPTDSLESNLVAGPYHPAFGELVSSREWLKRVKKIFAAHPGKKMKFTISIRDLSSFKGLKKSNIKRFETLGLADRMEVEVDKNMERGSLHYAVR